MSGAVTKALSVLGVGLFAVLWLGGIVAYARWGAPPPGSEWTAPAFLLLGAALATFSAAEAGAARSVRLLLVALFGFLLEALGVATGWPFGEYTYTEVLGPQALGVPLVLGAAWLLVASWADGLARRLVTPRAARVVLGAALMTALDLVLDPLAAGPLGYWTWPAGGTYHGIPASNFFGWFMAGLVAQALLVGAADPGRLERRIGLALLGFFSLLASLFGLWLPALVGWGLVGVEGVAVRAGLTSRSDATSGRW